MQVPLARAIISFGFAHNTKTGFGNIDINDLRYLSPLWADYQKNMFLYNWKTFKQYYMLSIVCHGYFYCYYNFVNGLWSLILVLKIESKLK